MKFFINDREFYTSESREAISIASHVVTSDGMFDINLKELSDVALNPNACEVLRKVVPESTIKSINISVTKEQLTTAYNQIGEKALYALTGVSSIEDSDFIMPEFILAKLNGYVVLISVASKNKWIVHHAEAFSNASLEMHVVKVSNGCVVRHGAEIYTNLIKLQDYWVPARDKLEYIALAGQVISNAETVKNMRIPRWVCALTVSRRNKVMDSSGLAVIPACVVTRQGHFFRSDEYYVHDFNRSQVVKIASPPLNFTVCSINAHTHSRYIIEGKKIDVIEEIDKPTQAMSKDPVLYSTDHIVVESKHVTPAFMNLPPVKSVTNVFRFSRLVKTPSLTSITEMFSLYSMTLNKFVKDNLKPRPVTLPPEPIPGPDEGNLVVHSAIRFMYEICTILNAMGVGFIALWVLSLMRSLRLWNRQNMVLSDGRFSTEMVTRDTVSLAEVFKSVMDVLNSNMEMPFEHRIAEEVRTFSRGTFNSVTDCLMLSTSCLRFARVLNIGDLSRLQRISPLTYTSRPLIASSSVSDDTIRDAKALRMVLDFDPRQIMERIYNTRAPSDASIRSSLSFREPVNPAFMGTVTVPRLIIAPPSPVPSSRRIISAESPVPPRSPPNKPKAKEFSMWRHHTETPNMLALVDTFSDSVPLPLEPKRSDSAPPRRPVPSLKTPSLSGVTYPDSTAPDIYIGSVPPLSSVGSQSDTDMETPRRPMVYTVKEDLKEWKRSMLYDGNGEHYATQFERNN